LEAPDSLSHCGKIIRYRDSLQAKLIEDDLCAFRLLSPLLFVIFGFLNFLFSLGLHFGRIKLCIAPAAPGQETEAANKRDAKQTRQHVEGLLTILEKGRQSFEQITARQSPGVEYQVNF
jgi:hypothetical protein